VGAYVVNIATVELRSSDGSEDRLLQRSRVTVVWLSCRRFLGTTRITEDLAKDLSASGHGVLQVFKDENSCSLAQDEAFALAIVRP
jgi:hypothetical protein